MLQSQEQGTGGLESGSRVCSVTGHLPPDLACRPPPSLGLEEGSHCSLPAVGSVHYEHGNFSASFISCPFARLRPSHTYSPTIGNPRDSLCSLSAHIRKKKKKKKHGTNSRHRQAWVPARGLDPTCLSPALEKPWRDMQEKQSRE